MQVAPVMPNDGPIQPMVVTLMPMASKIPMPSKVKSSAKKAMNASYSKKNWLTRIIVSWLMSWPFILTSMTIRG